jgi:hypothetical protein
MNQFAIATLFAFLACSLNALAQNCAGNPVAVQILDCGGPRLNGYRVSFSYLLWIADHARVLVDIGGGAFVRFGQSKAQSQPTRSGNPA